MLIRLMRFNATAEYIAGKKMAVADALSRSPQEETADRKEEVARLMEDVTAHIDSVRLSWAATDRKLEEIAKESKRDPLIQLALRYTQDGWPKYIADYRRRTPRPVRDSW